MSQKTSPIIHPQYNPQLRFDKDTKKPILIDSLGTESKAKHFNKY